MLFKKKKHPQKGSEKECDSKCQELIDSESVHVVIDLECDDMYHVYRKSEIARTNKDGSLAFLDLKIGKTHKCARGTIIAEGNTLAESDEITVLTRLLAVEPLGEIANRCNFCKI